MCRGPDCGRAAASLLGSASGSCAGHNCGIGFKHEHGTECTSCLVTRCCSFVRCCRVEALLMLSLAACLTTSFFQLRKAPWYSSGAWAQQ